MFVILLVPIIGVTVFETVNKRDTEHKLTHDDNFSGGIHT